ncbi:MAG TPA: hypothetical protein VNA89_15495 [Gemmatimonadaceae bacterium]|nr:hypothetical protein [Gemmatimonadaceae bacterium]
MAESNFPPELPYTPESPPPQPARTARRLRAESIALRQRAVQMSEASQALRDTFAAALLQLETGIAPHAVALSEVRAARARLHHEAARLALLLRAGGAPPEEMVVEVKREIGAAAPHVWGPRRQALAAEVVRWSIETYYAA